MPQNALGHFHVLLLEVVVFGGVLQVVFVLGFVQAQLVFQKALVELGLLERDFLLIQLRFALEAGEDRHAQSDGGRMRNRHEAPGDNLVLVVVAGAQRRRVSPFLGTDGFLLQLFLGQCQLVLQVVVDIEILERQVGKAFLAQEVVQTVGERDGCPGFEAQLDAEQVVVHVQGPFHREQAVVELAHRNPDLVHIADFHASGIVHVLGMLQNLAHVVQVFLQYLHQAFADQDGVIGIVNRAFDIQSIGIHLLRSQGLGNLGGLDAHDPLPVEHGPRSRCSQGEIVFHLDGKPGFAHAHALAEVGLVVEVGVDLGNPGRDGFGNHLLLQFDVEPRSFEALVVFDRETDGILKAERLGLGHRFFGGCLLFLCLDPFFLPAFGLSAFLRRALG